MQYYFDYKPEDNIGVLTLYCPNCRKKQSLFFNSKTVQMYSSANGWYQQAPISIKCNECVSLIVHENEMETIIGLLRLGGFAAMSKGLAELWTLLED